MSFGYIGDISTKIKQQVKNEGILSVTELLELEKDGFLGGSLELIAEQTHSTNVTTIDFLNIKEDVYDVHMLQFSNIQGDGTAGSDLSIRFYESGVEESASVYQFAFQYGTSGGSFSEVKDTSESYLRALFNTGNATNEKANSYNYFYNLGNSAKYSFHTNQNVLTDGNSTFNMAFGGGVLPQASTVNQIKLFNASGNFTCTAKLYGVKQI